MIEGEIGPEPILIAAISGSLGMVNYTRMAAEIALRGAAELGAQVRLLDLRDYTLAFVDGRRDESTYPPDVHRLRRDVQQAQGIILATPTYHGSFSGVLKNALDLMGFNEFEGKMIGMVGISGGRAGAMDALDCLRNVGRALHAWVIPEQVGIPEVGAVFDRETGAILDPELEGRLLEVGREVTRYAYLHTSRRVREFLELWERAPQNPGGVDR